jgi:hypothetical protein
MDLPTGSTVVCGTSGFSGNILGLEWTGIKREQVKTSDFADVYEQYIPSTESTPGALALEVAFNPDTVPPFEDSEEVVRLTFPGLEQWEGAMFLASFEFGAPLDGKMTANLAFTVSGAVTVRTLTVLINDDSNNVLESVSGSVIYVQ